MANEVITESDTASVISRSGMFSWDPDQIKKPTDTVSVLKQLDVGVLYQYIKDTQLNTKELKLFVKTLSENDIAVYYLTGSPDMGFDGNATTMKKMIDKVCDYNAKVEPDEAIGGILFDVESYLDDKWKTNEKKYFTRYDAAMTSAYKYAKSKGLYMVTCIPFWLEKIDSLLLGSVIKHTDEIAVMNYLRKNEAENIKSEAAYASYYGKAITCIYEFQKPGEHSLVDLNTYYNKGIDAAQKSYEAVYDSIGYDKLNFAYHSLKTITQLINK